VNRNTNHQDCSSPSFVVSTDLLLRDIAEIKQENAILGKDLAAFLESSGQTPCKKMKMGKSTVLFKCAKRARF